MQKLSSVLFGSLFGSLCILALAVSASGQSENQIVQQGGTAQDSDTTPGNATKEGSKTKGSATQGSASKSVWKSLPEKSQLHWLGKKPDGQHNGGFNRFAVEVDAPGGTLSLLKMVVDTDSIFTDTEKLTGHLKSPDFFNVREHPTATFVSTGFYVDEKGQRWVKGSFTMLDTTKEITIPIKLEKSPDGVRLTSQFSLDRSQFGMNYGQGKIDNNVMISATVILAR